MCPHCGDEHPDRLGCPRFDSYKSGTPVRCRTCGLWCDKHQPGCPNNAWDVTEVVGFGVVFCGVLLIMALAIGYGAGRLSAIRSPECACERDVPLLPHE